MIIKIRNKSFRTSHKKHLFAKKNWNILNAHKSLLSMSCVLYFRDYTYLRVRVRVVSISVSVFVSYQYPCPCYIYIFFKNFFCKFTINSYQKNLFINSFWNSVIHKTIGCVPLFTLLYFFCVSFHALE